MFPAEIMSALFSIIIINVLLSGDNAIVVGLAARNLPKNQQKKAIIWGTFGAVAIRIVATLVVVWLLKIPGLLAAGGLMLIWIAYSLIAENEETEHVSAQTNLAGAIRTIIVADFVMGLDNVLGIAGAAQGNLTLIIIGLAISIPIVVFSSTLIVKLVERFPLVIYAGSAVLGWTAVQMIVEEPILHSFLAAPIAKWGLAALVIPGIIVAGVFKSRSAASDQAACEPQSDEV